MKGWFSKPYQILHNKKWLIESNPLLKADGGLKRKQNMQHLIDTLSKGWRAERSLSQMTLGELIKILEGLPNDKLISKITAPHSYRGYYSDLAFEMEEGEQTVGELLNVLKTKCIEQTFTGYKGGDFEMDKNTPMWIAEYGSCGVKMMEIKDGSVLTFITKEDD